MDIDKIKQSPVVKKIIIIFVVLLVVASLVSTIIISENFLNRESFLKNEKSAQLITVDLASKEHINWLKTKAEEVKADNISALFLKNKSTSHSYMILLHSLTTEKSDMASYAYHFYDLGFNVYIPDYMSNKISLGVEEQKSVVELVNYILKADSKANVFIFGIGIGGATALLSSDDLKQDNVKGIISDSAYSDVKEVFKENIRDIYGVPSFPTVALSSLYVKITRGLSFSEINVRDSVKNSQVPILYIHGTEDNVVPVQQSNELYEVTNVEGTDHVTIHGAKHGQTMSFDSEKYWREIDAFIRNSMDF